MSVSERQYTSIFKFSKVLPRIAYCCARYNVLSLKAFKWREYFGSTNAFNVSLANRLMLLLAASTEPYMAQSVHRNMDGWLSSLLECARCVDANIV